jgi:hypothetical protein
MVRSRTSRVDSFHVRTADVFGDDEPGRNLFGQIGNVADETDCEPPCSELLNHGRDHVECFLIECAEALIEEDRFELALW